MKSVDLHSRYIAPNSIGLRCTLREELGDAVEQFLAAGGRIGEVSPGVTGISSGKVLMTKPYSVPEDNPIYMRRVRCIKAKTN